jgi:hypothetical protein
MSRRVRELHAAILSAGCLFGLVAMGCSKDKILQPDHDSRAFAVSSVVTKVNRADYSGPCPGTFDFSAQITATDSGVVVYRWERSDGWQSPLALVEFTSAGDQTITSSWSPDTHGSFWQRMHVLSPNEILSGQASFTNQCGTTVTARATVVRNGTTCPGTYDFTATIAADAPVNLTYRWEGSDGTLGPWGSLGLAGPPVTVTMSRVMTQNGTFSERVHILAPAQGDSPALDMYSTAASFENHCSGFSATAVASASDGACTDIIEFTANIWTTDQGTVTYRWERSDGQLGPTENLEFGAAGTKTVTTSSPSPTGGAFSEHIHILVPNDVYSNDAVGEPYWDACCWGCID